LARRVRLRAYNRLLGMSRQVIDSYTAVTANSTFTGEWIQKMWGVSAPVLYSACERMGPAYPKEKIICLVGRFVGEGRTDDKHQTTMLAMFRRLEGLHKDGWQLHFAGTVMPDARAKKRADHLAELARGYPVVFHFNADFVELRDLYRRAAIYWHATGYGSSAHANPEMQEHFGITTVEAMSAGAVPVVINRGGQREIVTHGVDGFLWDDLDSLAEHTQRLARDADLWQRFSRQAVRSSARFSREAFSKRTEQLIGVPGQGPDCRTDTEATSI
jgi:glycosyltransferase involved in cell wall biosynthesis